MGHILLKEILCMGWWQGGEQRWGGSFGVCGGYLRPTLGYEDGEMVAAGSLCHCFCFASAAEAEP